MQKLQWILPALSCVLVSDLPAKSQPLQHLQTAISFLKSALRCDLVPDPGASLNGAAESLGLIERDEKGNIVSGEIGTHTLEKHSGIMLIKMGLRWSCLWIYLIIHQNHKH